jgi:hypothetical protein
MRDGEVERLERELAEARARSLDRRRPAVGRSDGTRAGRERY